MMTLHAALVSARIAYLKGPLCAVALVDEKRQRPREGLGCTRDVFNAALLQEVVGGCRDVARDEAAQGLQVGVAVEHRLLGGGEGVFGRLAQRLAHCVEGAGGALGCQLVGLL